MTCVVFPHAAWPDFPYPSLLRRIAEREAVYYVDGAEADLPPWLGALEAERLSAWSEPDTLALVLHPYWIDAAAALRPGRLVVFAPGATFEEEARLWSRRFVHASARADLFASASESRYLNAAFRNRSAWLLREDGLSSDEYERLFFQAVAGEHAAAAIASQSLALRRHYETIREQTGPHETVSFLLSAYGHLSDMPDFAETHLLEAFAHAVSLGRTDCLATHYRFRSALLAAGDELEQAVAAFGISAIDAKDKESYESICVLLEHGRSALAKAWLLRVNDDIAGALEAAAKADGSEEAARLRAELLLDAGKLEEALALMSRRPPRSRSEKRDVLLLEGTIRKLLGDVHGAISRFLEAAELDWDAVAAIADMKADREGLTRLRTSLRERRESGTTEEASREETGDVGTDSESPADAEQ
ncbi:hypothetical protein [Cohnella sp. GCM10027633]|uniref:hypothetical protein n=1 Tax=unclassified Cohnella TaxID=2636738 RepID=UPI00363876B3